ncbi:NADP-dependent oxidoreductase (plasmid) [Streptomyces sp. CG1]|uniref:NADP-dependent oxidoreductase n=1 Tax=Streptomyces sp. CG1 TaxID=1287523 RepID=UPI0034E25C6D
MRAVSVTSFGGPDVLEVTDVPVPALGKGKVRVRVAAAPVHPLDLVVRSGGMGPRLPQGPRYVLGADFAGTVAAVGPGVCGFTFGQSVVGMSNWPETKAGAQAEFVTLPEAQLAPAPTGVQLATAATLPLNALTAVQALDILGLPEGSRLAVTGAGGGVGGFAVELARGRGLDVVGVASAQDGKFLTRLDATFVPRSDDPAAALRKAVPDGVDGLLDCAAIGAPVLAAVRDGGTFVAVKPPAPPAAERDIRVGLVLARADAAQLRELVALVEAGRLTLREPRTLPLEKAAEAHTAFAAGGLRGGVVLVPHE